MIRLLLHDGVAYVWNANDWYELRTKFRICGALIGSIASFPRQNDFLGLPMALMAEEAALLIEKDIGVLCDLTNIIDKPSDEQKQMAEDLEKKLLEQQSDSLKRKRSEQLSQKIDIILAGKKRKLITKGVPDADIKIDKEVLLQEEINKLPTLSSAHVLLHLPLEHPWPTEHKNCSIEDLKPSVLEGKKLTSYRVYKDLWQKGHYITEGSKFGADFLVYPGDPVRFHASYMVRCVTDKSVPIRPVNLVTFGRLSVAVNKLAVLASCCENGQVTYQTLQWHDSVNG